MTTELATKYIELRPHRPAKPSNVSPAEGADVGLTPTLTSSTFVPRETQGEIHIASRWRVGNDSAMTSIVYDSGVTTDLLSHQVPVSAALQGATTYFFDVTHIGAKGGESNFSDSTSMITFLALANLFSLSNFTGNSPSNQAVNTGLDMQNDGGFGFVRNLTISERQNYITESVGAGKYRPMISLGASFTTDVNSIVSYDLLGYTVGSNNSFNGSGNSISNVSGIKAKGFCDVLTYTGDDTTNRALNHILDQDVGFIMVMMDLPSATFRYTTWFSTLAANQFFSEGQAGPTTGNQWGGQLPTSTQIFVGKDAGLNDTNLLGRTYTVLVLPKDSPVKVKTGNYTGSGLAGLKVNNSFTVAFALIRSHGASESIHDNVSGVANSRSLSGANNLPLALLESFDAGPGVDGITLTNSSVVNANGTIYEFLFIGDPNI